MTLHILYTTSAHAEGGRNGSTRNADGLVMKKGEEKNQRLFHFNPYVVVA